MTAKLCPHCSEVIPAETDVCSGCGNTFSTPEGEPQAFHTEAMSALAGETVPHPRLDFEIGVAPTLAMEAIAGPDALLPPETASVEIAAGISQETPDESPPEQVQKPSNHSSAPDTASLSKEQTQESGAHRAKKPPGTMDMPVVLGGGCETLPLSAIKVPVLGAGDLLGSLDKADEQKSSSESQENPGDPTSSSQKTPKDAVSPDEAAIQSMARDFQQRSNERDQIPEAYVGESNVSHLESHDKDARDRGVDIAMYYAQGLEEKAESIEVAPSREALEMSRLPTQSIEVVAEEAKQSAPNLTSVLARAGEQETTVIPQAYTSSPTSSEESLPKGLIAMAIVVVSLLVIALAVLVWFVIETGVLSAGAG